MKLSLLLHILPFAVIPFIAEGVRDSEDKDAAGGLLVSGGPIGVLSAEAVDADQLVEPDKLIEGLSPDGATTDVLASFDLMKQLRFELCYAEVEAGRVRLTSTFSPPEEERNLTALFKGLITDIVTIGQGLMGAENWKHNVAVQEDNQGRPYLDNADGFFEAWLKDRSFFFREGASVLVLAPKDIAVLHGHWAKEQNADFHAAFLPEGFRQEHSTQLGDYLNLMTHLSIYTLVDILVPEYVEGWVRDDIGKDAAEEILEKLTNGGLEMIEDRSESLAELFRGSLLELRKAPLGHGTQRSGMSRPFGAGFQPALGNYGTYMWSFTVSGLAVGALERGAGDCMTFVKVARGQMTSQQALQNFKRPNILISAARSGAEGAFSPSTMAAGGVMGGPGYLSHVAGGYGEQAALDALARMQNALVRHAPQTAEMVGATRTPVAGNFMRAGVPLGIWGAYFHLDKKLMGGAENLSPSQKAIAAVTAGHQLTMTMAAYEQVAKHGAQAPKVALRSVTDALATPSFLNQGFGRIAKTGMANTKQFAIINLALTAVEKLDRSS